MKNKIHERVLQHCNLQRRGVFFVDNKIIISSSQT